MTSNVFTEFKAVRFREVYFDIKQKIDELLYGYNNVDFMINPAVDVEAIAKENGIKAIEYVSREEIPEKHATLENGVIKLNKDDVPVEQRFSIGHELEHHFRREADELNGERNQKKQTTEPWMAGMDNSIDDALPALLKYAARSDYEQLIPELKKLTFFNERVPLIASGASERLGKPIPEDKAYGSIAKLICMEKNRLGNGFIKVFRVDFVAKAADDLYNEEIADYFAANLLVPIERFMLWEDRPDEEIAAAFKVPVECIEKRREEIELELEYLAE